MADMQDDGFGVFRTHFKGAKTREEKQALMQQLEDGMYQQLRDALGPEYGELETQEQPPAGSREERAGAYETPEYQGMLDKQRKENPNMPEGDRRVAEMELAKKYRPQDFRPAIDDGDDAEPDGDSDDMIGGVPTNTLDDMGPPVDEMDPHDPRGRGRIEYDKQGNEMPNEFIGGTDGDTDDPDQPPYTFPLPAGSMKGAPYPVEGDDKDGVGDTFYSKLYRWEKDNGAFDLEFGSPEYEQFVKNYEAKRQRGNGRAVVGDEDGMPSGKPGVRGMFGRMPAY